jgi:Domain of unknown function (DUF4337)
MDSPSPAPAPGDKPRSLKDQLFNSTPVVLSVLATVLAGVSSREMTLAQYHRSLATQSQSKAGDAWGFFQAKRIRGTTLEASADLLEALAPPDRVDPAALEQGVTRLAEEFRRADAEVDRVASAVERIRGGLGGAKEPLGRATAKLRSAVNGKADQAEQLRQKVIQTLGQTEVKEAFQYLATSQLPPVDRHEIEAPAIREAAKALALHRPEEEVARLAAKLDIDQLEQAVAAAEANARSCEDRGQPVGDQAAALDRLVGEEVSLVRPFHRAVRDLRAAVADLPAGDGPDEAELRAATTALERTAASLKATSDELHGDVKAARQDYTARRYRREAQYNQEVAVLYELLVRKEGAVADKHRDRSYLFFYAMLLAQTGVTIGSLALAVRRKSVLWGMASVAGLTALLFATYVFLGM